MRRVAMSLEVWQGTSDPQVVQTRTESNLLIAEPYINVPPGTGSINEGRIITVRRAVAGQPPIAAAPGNTATAGAVTTQWVIEADSNNVPHAMLDQSFQCELQTGGTTVHLAPGGRDTVQASHLRFKTSQGGLDKYLVTDQGTGESVRIDVWKQILYRYVELQRTSGTGTNSLMDISSDVQNGVLNEALSYFNQFGIYFEPSTVTTGGPADGSNVAAPGNNATLTTSALRTLLGLADDASSRPPRELRICAAERFSGTVLGWGGSNLVAVACGRIDQTCQQYTADRQSYQEYASSLRGGGTPSATDGVRGAQASSTDPFPQWARRHFSSTLSAREETFYRELVSDGVGVGYPARLRAYQKFQVLIHEAGHALGLVPQSSTYGGGISSSGWHDSSHGGHCRCNSCVMWWEAEEGSVVLFTRPGSNPVVLCQQGDTKCNNYMRTCDLGDIRSFPS
jgi:hypothetical protein